MAPSPSSSTTTSVQVALRIRPPTNQDASSIPARFQRTVVHAASSTSVAVEATSSTPAAAGASAAASTSSGPAPKKQHFNFDQVHGPSTTQHSLFTETAQPLVSRFLEGFNCTILAYGQTSSGKTFTMTGVDLDANPSDPNNGMGIIPRAVASIFSQARQLKEERGGTWNYSIKGSFIEIYNEDLIDLLSMDDGAGGRREVQIREDKGGHIIWGGLREVGVKNPSEVMTLIRKGTSIRRTNETDMNAQSSRSHAIFSLTLTQKKYTGSGAPPRSSSPLPPGGRSPSRLARPGSVYTSNGASGSNGRVSSPTFGRPATPSFAAAMGRGGLRPSSALGHAGDRSNGADDESGEWVTIVSKFHFVDLAGSERLKRTAAAGERIKEGISINSGLLALGNVISALGDPSRSKSHTATHVPYRDSKLTRLLQDSLGGNAHTLMIACVSPAEWNAAETINTLKYANRARNIKNRAVVNEKEDGWDDVEWLQGTVTRLRKELKSLKSGGSISGTADIPDIVEGAGKKVLAQMTELQNNYEDLREKFVERTEELTRLRRELGEKHRSGSGAVSGTGKYEEIVGPVIEEYEKTISAMEAELSLNRAALRHTNEMVEEKEEELTAITERHSATELYVEELRSRVAKLTEREASTEAYVRDLEDKIRAYDETSISSSESMTDLKREISRFKDAESYSSRYISDLEARLGRSDESILSLQQTVARLEQECDRRQEEVNVLQARLDSFRQDGEAWRSDLEERERKVRELEEKMEEWEKKRQDAGNTRARLGNVVDEVASARRSLEIDLGSPPASPTEANGVTERQSAAEVNGHATHADTYKPQPNSAIEKQFHDLQETHNATLVDLASVSSKYRDALREISDLAAQIQEAKLANPSENASDITDSDRPPERTTRRRMSKVKESSEPQYNSGGKRLFFRQAASAESLHSRSLSQSQSLSQELSSVRSRKTSSSSHGTSSSHSPSPSHAQSTSTLNSLMGSRPNLSISLPNGNGSVSPSERSAVSLEKEIMRLQEVLKEREAEISSLEISLKESRESHTSFPVDHSIPLGNGDTSSISPEVYLSPQTRNQFDNIRRSMVLVNGNGHVHDGNDSETGKPDADESLDRLNELMLSMAQKEATHREAVDALNTELNMVRRQLDELTTLSRDQTLNMSTEVENLRERHQSDLAKLSTIQKRESDLLDTLSKLETDHHRAMQELETSHAHVLAEKQAEVDGIIARLKEDHELSLASLRDELSVATATLEKAMRDHEEAFGKARAGHEEELRKQAQAASDGLARAREEHEIALQKAIKEHEESMKHKDSEATSNLYQTEEEYYNALTKLRGDHAEALQKHAAEAAAVLEKLKEEHAAELRMTEIAKEGSISASESSRATALQELQEEHASAISRKEALHSEALESLKAEHTRVLSDKDEGHQLELNKLRNAMTRKDMTHQEEVEALKAEHVRVLSAKDEEISDQLQRLSSQHDEAVSKLKAEWQAEHNQLNSALSALKGDSSAAADKARSELDAAIQSLKEQQVMLLHEVEGGHEKHIAQLQSSHEAALKTAEAESAAKLSDLLRSHTEEMAILKSQHQQEVLVLNSTLVAMEEQHKSSLEELRLSGQQTILQEKDQLSVTLEELKLQHSKEREVFLKDKELLIHELESYKVAAEEFASIHERTRQNHEQSISQKDGLVKDVQQQLANSQNEKEELLAEVSRLRAELDNNRSEQSRLIQEASKRESLVEDLERHRSVLAELQENLQRVKDEKDTLQTEKTRSDNLLRELQAQISRSTSPPNARPATDRNASFNRVQALSGAKLPPPTPPPSVPPPPAPRSVQHDPGHSISSSQATSSIISSSSRDSQQPQPDSPATSVGPTSTDLSSKVEQQSKQLDEQEAMIKTLNKQLTHCESDLQTHMDLVSTLETSLGDSEKNLRKARMHATEIARERDRLNGENESLRQELNEVKREVANVRKSIVEEKQSYEQRLDEERKAKERARQQLDQRMEELTLKRKSKFACL